MKHRPVVFLALLAVILLLAAAASADTLYLKNGKTFEGKLVSDSGGEVKFKTSFGLLTFPSDQVDRIEKGRTKMDEFRDRRKALANDDYPGLLDLARWCGEQKLIAQRKQVLRDILKSCPNHPDARLENGEIYRDRKWVDNDGPPPRAAVRPGERIDIPETRASVVLPEKWKLATAKNRVDAVGPDLLAVAPVLTVALGEKAADPAAAFPEKEGWSKPVEAKAKGFAGVRSRREFVEDGSARVELVAILNGEELGLRVNLRCLARDADGYSEAIDLVLRSLTVAAAALDYTNEHYGYALNLPDSEAFSWEQDEVFDLLVQSRGKKIEEYATLWVVTGDPGQEADEVREAASGFETLLKSSGDVTFEGEGELGGVKGRLVDGTYLDDGTPMRLRVLTVERKGRVYCIYCHQHEFGAKGTNAIWDVIVKSFRFLE